MSIITNHCLEHIIGISDTDCACFTDKPAEVNESQTELYLDQLIPLDLAKGMESCKDGDLWDILMLARAEGIIKVQSDITASLMNKWDQALHQYKGKIGEIQAKNIKNTSKQYAALMIYCKDVRGGTFTLNKIGAIFTGTGIRNITIYDNLGTNYGTIAIDTIAYTHFDNTINPAIEFPMHSENVENLIYYIVYDVDITNPSMDNMLVCASCTKLQNAFDFCIANPYFNKKHDRRYFWAEWLMVGGITFDSLDELWDRDVIPTPTNYLWGLTVDLSLNCEPDSVICLEDVTKEHPLLFKTIGFVVLWSSAMIAIKKILNSAQLNRATMAHREQMDKNYKEWDAEYKTTIPYIAENLDTTNTDCLKCREKIKVKTVGIY